MASLAVVVIILGCVAFQYLKGTLVKAFATLMSVICASIAAFAYFESLSKVFVGRDIIVPWAQTASFGLLFVLVFAILQTIASLLTRKRVDLGLLPERIGRVVCGISLGLMLSGTLLTALAMAPLPNKYPYQRFDKTNPDPQRPVGKALLNADGFSTGWFGIVSSGSFSGKRSFAAMHPNYLDQLYLNRQKTTGGISLLTKTDAIELPPKAAAWPAPEDLKDSKAKPLPSKSGYNLTIVRVGMNKDFLRESGKFTLAQLRLICRQKGDTKDPLAIAGKTIYPSGYLRTADRMQLKQLDEMIELDAADFTGRVRWIDFAFYVPNDLVPMLVQFKQNNVAQIPPPVSYEQAPAAVPFIQVSGCSSDIAELEPVSSAKIYGTELAAGTKLLAGLELDISDANQWQSAQTEQSIQPAQFDENGKINCVRAELKIEQPAEDQQQAPKKKSAEKRAEIAKMLNVPGGYKLLSLKCNNPSVGEPVTTGQLPLLVELSGEVHHPVGVIASGRINEQLVYEFDYCSLTTEQAAQGLTIAEDGTVTTSFPDDTVWLPEKAQSISEFYVLYLVKSGKKKIIISVQSAGSQSPAGFKEYEGFFIK